MSVFEKMAHIHDPKLLRHVSDDGALDHVGDSTPGSGVVTPRPDPADKRLPSIMHSFFGQVGATSPPTPNPNPASPSPSSLPSSSSARTKLKTSTAEVESMTAPPSQPESASSLATPTVPSTTTSTTPASSAFAPRTTATAASARTLVPAESEGFHATRSTLSHLHSHHRGGPDGRGSMRTVGQPTAPCSRRQSGTGPGVESHKVSDDDEDHNAAATAAAVEAAAAAMVATASQHTDRAASPPPPLSPDALPPPPTASTQQLHVYPTPPLSHSSSIHQSSGDQDLGRTAVKDEQQQQQPRVNSAVATPSRLHDLPAVAASSSSRSRRHTFAVAGPLTNIITPSTVHASHISNPTAPQPTLAAASNTTYPATSPGTPTEEHKHHPTTAASSSYFELKRLTEGAAMPSAKKNTPPLTPRTSSNDAAGTTTTSNLAAAARKPSTSPTSQPLDAAVADTASPPEDTSNSSQQAASSPNKATGGAPAAPVVTPKGRLYVKISEARRLRPSHDPYVVCVFEWNEYISKGPRRNQSDPVEGDDRHGREEPGGIAIKRQGSDMGRPMAIPMKSRQSSNTSNSDPKDLRDRTMTDPRWDHEAVFDVVGQHSEVDVSVYDRSGGEAFLGHVRMCPLLTKDGTVTDGWFPLEARVAGEEHVSGEIYLQMRYQQTDKKQFGPEDFQILKLIGKGTFGQVYQVRKKDTQRIYAMKVLSKKVIVKKKEVAHTLGERNILVRTAMADSPFIVGLKFSFQTPADLYLVTDYMSGGELFWHLQKEGHFVEQRAKFYIAELILALQHLHQYDIVYRDLKPENILLDANGHIALCDFGLSKANLTKNDTTNTFCGTTEYLAPEVLLDEAGYTKMVDFWSLGVLVFEMCCGWSPFYAEDTQQMYKNIAFGKVRFPRDALSVEGRNFVKGLLNRNPRHRLGANHDAEELKAHPFFTDVNWEALSRKNVVPPFKPQLKSVLDTSNFDPEFTKAALDDPNALNVRPPVVDGSTPLSPGMQANFKGFTFVDESSMSTMFGGRDLRGGDVDMDEDIPEAEEDGDWDIVNPEDSSSAGGAGGRREDRMSGVVRSGEDGVFDSFDGV